ncbi:unnamed protein product [Rhizoctonia solani]|uniref:Protein kinase domain-containing protein n=1 Tax=Rhizoctonia solani TaxID=456999 RepID=A0A8H2WBU2_9AGAM|nr:unnamed protein product [Rhizoctonia solani]
MGTTGEAPSPRIGHGSGLAGDWLIVWGGGTYENDQFVRTDCCTYFLNLTTRHWTKLDIQPAPGARLAHATCVYGNRFIVFGGSGTENDSGPRNDLWSLDIDLLTRETPRWERIEVATESEVPSERMGHTMLAYENKLYIFGGRHCPNHMWKDTWYFDMDIRVWNRVACTGNCPPARGNFSATLVQDKMYIFGGYDDQKQLGDTWCFNISEQQWYNFPSMDYEPSPRSGHTLATIGKRVLAIGGSAQGELSPEMRTFVHVFNSDLISFSELGTGPQLISRDEWSGSTRIGDALEGDTHGEVDSSRAAWLTEELTSEGSEPKTIHSDRHDSSLDELVTGVENLEAGVSEARNEADFGPDKGNKPDTITRAMSATEILHYLIEHGCRDISKELIISHISDYPMSFGGFGDVYCATLQNGDRVGIKCVRMLTNSTSEGKKLLKSAAHELYVWSKCKHPNVIELLGVMLFRDQIAMVSPWLENGHLRAFLSHKSQVDRCDLCVQIADGVAYLHQKSIIHGDLKPENILISKDHNPKLTDFGNSALAEYTLQFTHSSTVQGMSLRWAAPEIIEEESKPTQASDVYALGMVSFCGTNM